MAKLPKTSYRVVKTDSGDFIWVKVRYKELRDILYRLGFKADVLIDRQLEYVSREYTNAIKKRTPVSKYPRIFDIYYSKGKLKRSVKRVKIGRLLYATIGYAYGLLVHFGFKGWSKKRAKPYVFESPKGLSKRILRKLKAEGRYGRLVVTRRVRHAGKTKRTLFITRAIRSKRAEVDMNIRKMFFDFIKGG